VLDPLQQARVFGDFGGEVLVFDARDVECVARSDAPLRLPPLAAPTLHVHVGGAYRTIQSKH